MSNKRKVISYKNLPSRPPLWHSLTAWLALDHFNAPQWLWGAVGLFFIVMWVVYIVLKTEETEVEIMENKK